MDTGVGDYIYVPGIRNALDGNMQDIAACVQNYVVYMGYLVLFISNAPYMPAASRKRRGLNPVFS